jgi:transcriptional regulator with XRE-family HTH domain
MDAYSSQLVGEIIELTGSMRQAAVLSGVSERHFQKWKAGRSSPSKRSLERIRLVLDSDTLEAREQRILLYSERAAQRQSVFLGGRNRHGDSALQQSSPHTASR